MQKLGIRRPKVNNCCNWGGWTRITWSKSLINS